MLLAVIAGGAEAQGATVSGIFQIVYGDPFDPRFGAVTLYFVTDDAGVTTQVEATPDAFGEFTPQQLLGQRVTVSGNRISLETVSAISVAPQDAAAVLSQPRISVTGVNKYVTLLCRFSGDASEDATVSYVQGLMGDAEPGMEDYWKEQSFDQLDLGDSDTHVHDWLALPKTRNEYIVSGQFDLTGAFNDCVAAHNTPELNFPDFFGINLMFNDYFAADGGFAFGGRITRMLDGQQKTYGVTWMPPWGYASDPNFFWGQAYLAHEMGHSLGAPSFLLPHSSGPYNATYDSGWDVMSRAVWRCVENNALDDPTYGCIGQHTIAYHKDLLGWIPDGRKFEPALGSETQIELITLDGPLPSILVDQYMMAEIPIPGTNDFYTVEYRKKEGYDEYTPLSSPDFPDDAVIIHKVDTNRSDRDAQVVDPELDGIPDEDPNDAEAMWTAGETFTDAANGITIAVNEAGPNGGFLVTITLSLGKCQGEEVTIAGTAGKNTIIGTPGNDVIDGKGGNDKIDGGLGDDIICGGAGNDKITGGDGNDSIEGGDGNDKIEGGNDNDDLFGQAGKDNVKGGEGDDDLDGGTGKDTLDGGGGIDTCINGEKVKNCAP